MRFNHITTTLTTFYDVFQLYIDFCYHNRVIFFFVVSDALSSARNFNIPSASTPYLPVDFVAKHFQASATTHFNQVCFIRDFLLCRQLDHLTYFVGWKETLFCSSQIGFLLLHLLFYGFC